MEIRFLLLTEVLEIHYNQITTYGGKSGIHDIHLLSSALGAPSATFDGIFLHTNIFEMAAAYLFHIVKNHPFLDGNKRAGVVATSIFLDFNGYDFNPPTEILVATVLEITKGEIDRSEVAQFIKQWTNHKQK